MGVPQFPQTLPQDTVVGRLGIGPGPAQAIPLDIAFERANRITVTAAGIEFLADGGGNPLTTGLKAFLEVPFAATITSARLFANVAGSIVIDVWKCNYTQFDGGVTHPVFGDSITAGTPPTIVASTKSEDTALVGWTVTLAKGDILGFNISSTSSVITRATLALDMTRIGLETLIPETSLNIPVGFYFPPASIWRVQDRMFIGEAAANFAGSGFPDTGTSWFSSPADGPGFLGTNSRLLVTTSLSPVADVNEPIAITGAAKSDNTTGGSPIGVAGSVDNARDATGGWGFYCDLTHNSLGGHTFGLEIAAKNLRANTTISPFSFGPGGVFGVWLAGGGDNSYGSPSTAPSTAGIVLLKNSQRWNAGMVFMNDSLTDGQAVVMSSVGGGTPHTLWWYDDVGNQRGSVRSIQLFENYGITLGDIGVQVDKAGSPVLIAGGTGVSPVNMILTTGAQTGNAASVGTLSFTDVDVDLAITPQGAGLLKYGTFVATPGAITGYITIKDSGGTLRRIAVTS